MKIPKIEQYVGTGSHVTIRMHGMYHYSSWLLDTDRIQGPRIRKRRRLLGASMTEVLASLHGGVHVQQRLAMATNCE